MVQVQATLLASLTISLFSAFLAMLGKQWLNRYDSTDMRGSAIERSHNRQRKLGGIVAWYFDHVMGSLPLMLQVALLLLGSALSRYLWEVDATVASVVLGMTALGVLLYVLIVIAGAISKSCPYQTPGAHILRHILHHHLPAFRSATPLIFAAVSAKCSEIIRCSKFYSAFTIWLSLMKRPWYSVSNIAYTLSYYLVTPPLALAVDCYRLLQVIFRLLVACGRTVYRWSHATTSPRPVYSPEQQTIASDLLCVSWILRTSLDRAAHLSAFKRLMSMPELNNLDPNLVVDCFSVFVGCININNDKMVVTEGLEQLATVSANSFFRTFHHLIIMDPTSSVLDVLYRSYNKVFPIEVDFTEFPFCSAMTMAHSWVNRFGNPRYVWWKNHTLPGQEHIPFSRRMAEAAQVEYRKMRRRKVPRWMLRSALHFLSLGSLSPASVVADYLTIIATDLGCEVPEGTSCDERCVRIQWIFIFLTSGQRTSRVDVKLDYPEARLSVSEPTRV